MQLVVLATLAAAALAYRNAPICMPPSCSIDSNCVDQIHGNGNVFDPWKCCGGSCVQVSRLPRDRLVGEPCMSTDPSAIINNYESCGGLCAGGLYCGADRRCHPAKGPLCNCTVASECQSNSCVLNIETATTVCSGSSITSPNGSPCLYATECASGVCTSNVCTGLPDSSYCNDDTQCTGASVCRNNGTFQKYCLPLCSKGSSACCATTTDCDGGRTYPVTQICTAGVCGPPPGLGQTCNTNIDDCGDGTLICDSACNDTTVFPSRPCVYAPSICQLPNTLATGAACNSDIQCPKGNLCVALNSTVAATCVALGTVPLGQGCGYNTGNVALCLKPADLCTPVGFTSNYICKESRTTPLYMPCYPSTLPECVKGSSCLYNSSGVYSCRSPLADGMNCTDYDTCGSGQCVPPPNWFAGCFSLSYGCTCAVPNVTPLGQNCTNDIQCQKNGTCAVLSNNNGQAVCVQKATQANGQQCNYTFQCSDPFAFCKTANNNYTCVNMQGEQCSSPNNCGDYPGGDYGWPTWDCSCNNKCVVLNRPTPAPAPSPIAPTVYTDPCQSKLDAFIAVNRKWQYPPQDYVTSEAALDGMVTDLTSLTPASQTLLIDFVCCRSCPGTTLGDRFESRTFQGWQVDCSKKTFTLLTQNICGDTAQLSFLGCWPTSPASTLSVGFVILFASIALLF